MWTKSAAGIIGGLLVSISLMLNLNYLIPLAIDARLMFGMIISWPIWTAMMVWCYAASGGLQAWKRCGGVLAVSVVANTLFTFMPV